MKKKIFSVIMAIVTVVSLFTLWGCGEDPDIVTDVKFSIYDNYGKDMISFYMTSDTKPHGYWEYSIENESLFTYFYDKSETSEYGTFGAGGEASFKTLILEPVAEGESNIDFRLTDGDLQYRFKLTVSKDKDGILRIKAEHIKE